MAHLKKFSKGATGNMFAHYDRKGGEKIGNENVNLEKSHLNYDLSSQQMSQGDFLKKRLSEIKVQNRADVNVMCTWVVTAPKTLDKGDEKEFFQQSYNFLEKKYGKENIISAWVHNDEVTPHLHFAFVPVVEDKKKGGYKLSAKECITRADLKVFHQQLERHLNGYGKFKNHVEILNDATSEGNKTVEELKKNNSAVKKEIDTLKAENKALQDDLKPYKDKEYSIRLLNAIEPKKTITGAIKGIDIQDINTIKAMALETAKWKETALEYKKAYEENKTTLETVIEESKNRPTQMDLIKEQSKRMAAESKLEKLQTALGNLPIEIKAKVHEHITSKNKGKGKEQNGITR